MAIRLALWASLGAMLWPSASWPHDVGGNRLTLVQREPNHLSLVFLIDYVGLLHRSLAPGATRAEFALACTSMGETELRRRVLQAQSAFAGQFTLQAQGGQRLPPPQLRWPDLSLTRRLLRETVMAAVVAPAEHAHQDPVEIQGDVVADGALGEVTLHLPAALGEVLVVSYRPNQRLLDAARGASAMIRF